MAVRVRDLIHQVAMRRGLQILSGRSRVLLQEFVHLRGQLRGRHLWTEGYLAVSAGATDKNG